VPVVQRHPIPVRPDLSQYVPAELLDAKDHQRLIPSIAKRSEVTRSIVSAVAQIPTSHSLRLRDARTIVDLPKKSVHLVLTSPPYWTLKKYRDTAGQLGHLQDYISFLDELDRVWRCCFDALVPGGRLVCVVGDVCLSRRKNGGRHQVIPLHSSIQERCRKIGFDNLTPIIWHKIANASYEVANGSSFLGKPYEPNSIIKNDIEFILMLRKPGGYRSPSFPERILSVIPVEDFHNWFQQIWTGIGGESTKNHPAPFPLTLAERLIRMYSFVGDTVMDPFMGTGTTNLAAAKWGRNSIGIEIDDKYFEHALGRLSRETHDIFGTTSIAIDRPADAKNQPA